MVDMHAAQQVGSILWASPRECVRQAVCDKKEKIILRDTIVVTRRWMDKVRRM